MSVAEVQGVEGMKAMLGKTVGPSEWREVTQEMIDDFAEISGDDQWIHVDVERARTESPFGTTIAHGNLTLSMIDGFRIELMRSTASGLGTTSAWTRVAFPAPLPPARRFPAPAGGSGEVGEVGAGWWQSVTRYTVEVEGSEKPACVADSVIRALPE